MRFTLIQYSNQFALGGWSWTVLTYRVQRKVLTSDLGQSYLLPTRVHDCTKKLFPGCVKLDEKIVFCLPTAGMRTQFFHPIFTQPGRSLLVQPCTFMFLPLLSSRCCCFSTTLSVASLSQPLSLSG